MYRHILMIFHLY